MRHVVDALLAVAWAPRCKVCEELLVAPSRGRMCVDCWQRVARIEPPVCDLYGIAIPLWAAAAPPAYCVSCTRSAGLTTPRRTVSLHDETLRAIVHALKYGGRRTLAVPLTQLMRTAGQVWLSDTDLIVPVPLHPLRRWRRGFNQAADLAAGLDSPVVNALRRTRHTRPQAVLARGDRLRAVGGAFRLREWRGGRRTAAAIRGRRILLVDDVVTTGATVEACASVLVDAGARSVRALSVAPATGPSAHLRSPR